jgi:hypothetical protein
MFVPGCPLLSRTAQISPTGIRRLLTVLNRVPIAGPFSSDLQARAFAAVELARWGHAIQPEGAWPSLCSDWMPGLLLTLLPPVDLV